MERDVSQWLQIDVERVLTVDRGRETILCDRSNAPNGATLIVRVSNESIKRLREECSKAIFRSTTDERPSLQRIGGIDEL